MKPGSTTLSAENGIFERLYLNNILGVDRINIFVNSDTGSDAGNNGSLELPYATIPRALQDLPYANLTGAKVFIYCEGSAPFILPDNFVFPQSQNPGGVEVDLSFPEPFSVQGFGPVNLIGVGVVEQLVPLANVVAQNNDPVSQLLTIVTNLVLVPGALAELYLMDDIGQIAAVQTNTVTDLIAEFAFPMVAPFTIYSRPLIQPQTPGSFSPTIRVRDQGSELVIAGFDIDTPFLGFVASLAIYNSAVQMYGCRLLGGLWAGFDLASSSLATSALTGLGNVYKSIHWTLGGSQTVDGLWFGVDFSITGSAVSVVCTAGSFIGGSAPWFGSSFEDASPSTLRFQNVHLDGNNGIVYSNNNLLCDNVLIDNSAGDAVLVRQNGYGELRVVDGAGNGGFGVKAEDGAHIQVSGGTNVTGAGGDLQSGNNAVNTWAAFHVAKNDIDTLVQLTRIWEP